MPIVSKNPQDKKLPLFVLWVAFGFLLFPLLTLVVGYPIFDSYSVTLIDNSTLAKMNFQLGWSLHSVLVWSGFCGGIFTTILALTKYVSSKDKNSLYVGLVLLCLGCNDFFYYMISSELWSHSSLLEIIVQVSYFVNRMISSILLLVGAIVLLNRKIFRIHLRIKTFSIYAICFIVFLYLAYSTISQTLQLTMPVFPLGIISNGLELIPLILSLLASYLFFLFYQKSLSVFTHALWVGSVAYCISQFYVSFGCRNVFDHCFFSSLLSKLAIFIIIAYGFILDYIRAIKDAYAASEAKTNFLANMSHEIRTPINGILCTSELLMDSELAKLPEEDRENIDIIHESANALLGIVDDILEFSKVEKGKIDINEDKISVSRLTTSVYRSFKNLALTKELFFNVILEPGTPEFINGDYQRIQQILLNLVGNAIKFTASGSVNITVKKMMHENKERLHFAVKDTGIGIKKEDIAKLFQEFNQVDNSITRKFGGTGLGLSICRKLAKLMQGKIHIRSEFGKGSTFTLEIPLIIPEGYETVMAKDILEESKSFREEFDGESILVVDDNAINLNLIKKVLTKLKLTVDSAKNGLEAVEQAKQTKYHLIFMDMQMPVLNGIDATKEIRSNSPINSKTPIVALTANVMQSDLDLCTEAGMNSTLTKPVKLEKIIETLNEYI